jgi:hypothetical protein
LAERPEPDAEETSMIRDVLIIDEGVGPNTDITALVAGLPVHAGDRRAGSGDALQGADQVRP